MQAALVAVAPLQLQPDMVLQVPGQLVMPCLKTHKALSSVCCWLDEGAIDGEKVGNRDHDGDIDGAINGMQEGETDAGLSEGALLPAKGATVGTKVGTGIGLVTVYIYPGLVVRKAVPGIVADEVNGSLFIVTFAFNQLDP
jgi:hypothetical protein